MRPLRAPRITPYQPSMMHRRSGQCAVSSISKTVGRLCYRSILSVSSAHISLPLALTLAFTVGCRAGDSCRFQHPPSSKETINDKPEPEQRVPTSESTEPLRSELPAMKAPPSRVVARPTPKTLMDDPRAFQINQIQRRFKPAMAEHADSTSLSFEMKPSDPDFPYEIEALECTLSVPKTYPASGKSSLTITNKDIPRGFQLNIERGFDRIATASPNAYLLGLMNRLDQQLESILSGQKAETITLVSNRAPPPKPADTEAAKPTPPVSQLPSSTKEQPSAEELSEAAAKRQADIRQLQARFGRLPHFVKSTDGITYTLPLDSPKRSAWPTTLQQLRSLQLKVPERYPLEPLEARLFNDSANAKAVEKAFKERSQSDRNATITQQVNYLSSHVKEMAVIAASETHTARPQHAAAAVASSSNGNNALSNVEPPPVIEDLDKSHIKHIPRPPEWDMPAGSEDDSASDSYDSAEDSDGLDEDQTGEQETPQSSQPSAPAERGILLSFPHLELHGIELLELTSLNLTVKCERCKESMDVEKLRSSAENSKMREVSCKKCATTLAVRFRADMIHVNSVRAGYLDLDGCTVIDMLPSHFTPTCSQCSTQYPAPGIVAVRGDNSLAICRECHLKMSVKIVEVKFLLVSASASAYYSLLTRFRQIADSHLTVRASRAPGRKKVRTSRPHALSSSCTPDALRQLADRALKPKENLGIVAGTELLNKGRCSHYKKSYRYVFQHYRPRLFVKMIS